MRLVAMGVPNEVYPTVLSQLHRVLKPGGWLEVVEVSYVALID
jgi:ubiquinone/menaquinone biosynthesis C-methylase UbiE